MADGPSPPGAAETFTVIADASKDRDRIKLQHNEQTKLTANILNNIATAFLVGGGVAPVLSAYAQTFGAAQILLSVVWIAVGIVLHIGGRLVLRSLK